MSYTFAPSCTKHSTVVGVSDSAGGGGGGWLMLEFTSMKEVIEMVNGGGIDD